MLLATCRSGLGLFFQYRNYAKSPDAFGPDERIRFTITKVVDLPWGKR